MKRLLVRRASVYLDLDAPKNATWAVFDLGYHIHLKGDLARARELHEEALALARCQDDRLVLGAVASRLGWLLVAVGELERGRALLLESLSILMELKSGVPDLALMGLGSLAYKQGQPLRAVRLLGAADALRRLSGRGVAGDQRPDHDRTLAALRSRLGAAAFTATWREGQTLGLAHAADLALSDAESEAENP